MATSIATRIYTCLTDATRTSWLTVERLPRYAPELNDIERSWRDLKRHQLANHSFRSADDLDRTIPLAAAAMSQTRTNHPWAKLQKMAWSGANARPRPRRVHGETQRDK